MSNNKNVPEDLGLKVGNKREKMLTEFRDGLAPRIKQEELNLEINKVVLDYIEKEISKAQEEFRNTIKSKENK